MPRGIDHLVVAVRDLDAARDVYTRLGFTLTPEARHPFGTANALIQLDGGFLELLGIADPAAIPEAAGEAFSFGAFNRSFLKKREGVSMLALRSSDPAADRADFEARGLPVHEPFRFERTAVDSDGSEKDLAFSLTFTGDPAIPDAAFFTCHNERPENFWRPGYQVHANGALRIAAAIMVARDPADFHEFFFYLTGQHAMRSDSLMVSLDTGAGAIEILTPVAARGLYGIEIEADPKPRFVATRIAVRDMAALQTGLEANDVAYKEIGRRIVVPAEAACGMTIAFAASAEDQTDEVEAD